MNNKHNKLAIFLLGILSTAACSMQDAHWRDGWRNDTIEWQLLHAIYKAQVEETKRLLAHGADPNFETWIEDYLSEESGNKQVTPMKEALNIPREHLPERLLIIKALLEKGAVTTGWRGWLTDDYDTNMTLLTTIRLSERENFLKTRSTISGALFAFKYTTPPLPWEIRRLVVQSLIDELIEAHMTLVDHLLTYNGLHDGKKRPRRTFFCVNNNGEEVDLNNGKTVRAEVAHKIHRLFAQPQNATEPQLEIMG